LPWLSVADNIASACELPAAARREKVARALARVGLADKANAWSRELSGGQGAAVAITRALVPQRSAALGRAVLRARCLHPADLQDHLLDLWNDTAADPRPGDA